MTNWTNQRTVIVSRDHNGPIRGQPILLTDHQKMGQSEHLTPNAKAALSPSEPGSVCTFVLPAYHKSFMKQRNIYGQFSVSDHSQVQVAGLALKSLVFRFRTPVGKLLNLATKKKLLV